jgi:protein-L-isoaspartate O-methyltransferase
MKSNKTRINNHYKEKKETVLNPGYPKTFFRSIGIKPYVKENEERDLQHFEKAIRNRFGKETLSLFKDALNAPDSRPMRHLCHTRLEFVKIWYGVDFPRICLVANLLQEIDIPDNRNVLDLGGGPGHLAFFMSKLWPDSKITVLDKYSHLGKEWANEIKENRVHFKDGQLSDLKTIDGCKFDLIIMSRVIGNLEKLSMVMIN